MTLRDSLLLCLLCAGLWGCSGTLTSNFLKYPSYVPGPSTTSVEVLTAEPTWKHIILGEIIIEAMGYENSLQGTIDKAKSLGAHAVRFTERKTRTSIPGMQLWRSIAYRRLPQE